jgi:hypothetical protein
VQFVTVAQWTMSTATPGGGSESTIFASLVAVKNMLLPFRFMENYQRMLVFLEHYQN